jgi:D-ribulokinase
VPPLFAGIDLGTSGCRICVIDADQREIASVRRPLPPTCQSPHHNEQEAGIWWQVVLATLEDLRSACYTRRIVAIAVDGTSGTAILCDSHHQPIAPALLYNDQRATAEATTIARLAPADSAAHGVASALAKALWLVDRYRPPAGYTLHAPADWITGQLCGKWQWADANSMLKFGWDAIRNEWPGWLDQLNLCRQALPTVVAPATPLGYIDRQLACRCHLQPTTLLCSGSSDSTAAIIASGAAAPGDAITALGSTLVVKVVTPQPIFSAAHGVYSQPYGNYWLAGGGSKSGGAVLRHFFSDQRLAELSATLDPLAPCDRDYYPLLGAGERFPVNDPAWPPRLSPSPRDDGPSLYALLLGIARIEAEGYRQIAALGAPPLRQITTTGGGATNRLWQQIRQQLLPAPIIDPHHSEAAYGSALLAWRGWQQSRQ